MMQNFGGGNSLSLRTTLVWISAPNKLLEKLRENGIDVRVFEDPKLGLVFLSEKILNRCTSSAASTDMQNVFCVVTDSCDAMSHFLDNYETYESFDISWIAIENEQNTAEFRSVITNSDDATVEGKFFKIFDARNYFPARQYERVMGYVLRCYVIEQQRVPSSPIMTPLDASSSSSRNVPQFGVVDNAKHKKQNSGDDDHDRCGEGVVIGDEMRRIQQQQHHQNTDDNSSSSDVVIVSRAAAAARRSSVLAAAVADVVGGDMDGRGGETDRGAAPASAGAASRETSSARQQQASAATSSNNSQEQQQHLAHQQPASSQFVPHGPVPPLGVPLVNITYKGSSQLGTIWYGVDPWRNRRMAVRHFPKQSSSAAKSEGNNDSDDQDETSFMEVYERLATIEDRDEVLVAPAVVCREHRYFTMETYEWTVEAVFQHKPAPWSFICRLAQTVLRALREVHGVGCVFRSLGASSVGICGGSSKHNNHNNSSSNNNIKSSNSSTISAIRLYNLRVACSYCMLKERAHTNLSILMRHFAAPEGLIEHTFTEESDVYSFGAMLFRLCTGTRLCDHVPSEHLDTHLKRLRDELHLESALPSARKAACEKSQDNNNVDYQKSVAEIAAQAVADAMKTATETPDHVNRSSSSATATVAPLNADGALLSAQGSMSSMPGGAGGAGGGDGGDGGDTMMRFGGTELTDSFHERKILHSPTLLNVLSPTGSSRRPQHVDPAATAEEAIITTTTSINDDKTKAAEQHRGINSSAQQQQEIDSRYYPQEFIDLVSQMLRFDPKARPTVDDLLLRHPLFQTANLPPARLQDASFAIKPVEKGSWRFRFVEERVAKAQLQCLESHLRFTVESVVAVVNPVLRAIHDETRTALKCTVDDEVAFYGHRKNATHVRDSILRLGLLRSGHPLNPRDMSQYVERGTIGRNVDGVYLSRFPLKAAEYTQEEHLKDGDTVEILFFTVVLGKSVDWVRGNQWKNSLKHRYDSFVATDELFLLDDDGKHRAMAYPSYVIKLRVSRFELWNPLSKQRFFITDQVLGTGGFGDVKMGLLLPQARPVACKIFRPEAEGSRDEFIRLCLHEFEVMKTFTNYRNVAQVIDFKVVKNEPILFMELLAITIGQIINQFGPIDHMQATSYFKQAAAGLQALALEGYLHGDVKVENLMLSSDGTLKVTDFGLAYKRGSQLQGATPFYIAPELLVPPPLPDVAVTSSSSSGFANDSFNSVSSTGFIRQSSSLLVHGGTQQKQQQKQQHVLNSSQRSQDDGDHGVVGGVVENLSGTMPPLSSSSSSTTTTAQHSSHQFQQKKDHPSTPSTATTTSSGIHNNVNAEANFSSSSWWSIGTHSSDVYSLGVSLWKMLAGTPTPPHLQRPPGGLNESYVDIRQKYFMDNMPEIPEEYAGLTEILLQCIDLKPENRPRFSDILAFSPTTCRYGGVRAAGAQHHHAAAAASSSSSKSPRATTSASSSSRNADNNNNSTGSSSSSSSNIGESKTNSSAAGTTSPSSGGTTLPSLPSTSQLPSPSRVLAQARAAGALQSQTSLTSFGTATYGGSSSCGNLSALSGCSPTPPSHRQSGAGASAERQQPQHQRTGSSSAASAALTRDTTMSTDVTGSPNLSNVPSGAFEGMMSGGSGSGSGSCNNEQGELSYSGSCVYFSRTYSSGMGQQASTTGNFPFVNTSSVVTNDGGSGGAEALSVGAPDENMVRAPTAAALEQDGSIAFGGTTGGSNDDDTNSLQQQDTIRYNADVDFSYKPQRLN